MGEHELGPSKRIILQDLNVALSSNFKEMKAFTNLEEFIINHERYRQWLVELLSKEFVILCTARSKTFEQVTLEKIYLETGWKPNDYFFNDLVNKENVRYSAPEAKRSYLIENIFPKYGTECSIYFAIESNSETRAMYDSLGIECVDANRNEHQPWKTLPISY